VPVHQRGILPSKSTNRNYGRSHPVSTPAYQLGISVLSEQRNGSIFPSIEIDGHRNLEDLCAQLVEEFYGIDKFTLEFGFFIQPDSDSDQLKIVYCVIHNTIEPKSDVNHLPVLIERVNNESEITIDALPKDSLDFEIAYSAIEEIHQKMIRVTEAKSNTDGYQILLSLLPEFFDAKELQLAFDAIAGKPTPSGHLLSNTLLKNYRLGYKVKDPDRPPVTGRDLIQKVATEVPDGDDPDNFYIVEKQVLDDLLDQKREEYRLNYPEYFQKGGNRVTTLFRKKVI
jgi:hypothetical protein